MWMRRIFLLSFWLLSADTDLNLEKLFFPQFLERLYFTCGPIFWTSQVPSTSGPIGRAGRPWAALSAPGRIPGCRRGCRCAPVPPPLVKGGRPDPRPDPLPRWAGGSWPDSHSGGGGGTGLGGDTADWPAAAFFFMRGSVQLNSLQGLVI